MWDWIRGIMELNVELVRMGGYTGVTLLMFIESSFIPFPSEVVVPPAGYLAAKGHMSVPVVLFCSLLGSLLGAGFNYWVAVRWGRPFFHRYGRWFLVKEATLDRAEAFFAEHGEIGTFVGRLIPGVRQLISLPAGMARMHLGRFFLFTGLGAGIWCAVLLGIGHSMGQGEGPLDLALVQDKARHFFLVWLLPCLGVLTVGYIVLRKRRTSVPVSDVEGDGAP